MTALRFQTGRGNISDVSGLSLRGGRWRKRELINNWDGEGLKGGWGSFILGDMRKEAASVHSTNAAYKRVARVCGSRLFETSTIETIFICQLLCEVGEARTIKKSQFNC